MTMLWVGPSASSMSPISRDPSELSWGLQDVSSSSAGRTLDSNATMHKDRIAQKRKIKLSWKMPTAEQTSEILTAFNPEYVYVRYHDAMDNRWEVRQFYVGDRTAPVKWFQCLDGTRYETVSFDVIEV